MNTEFITGFAPVAASLASSESLIKTRTDAALQSALAALNHRQIHAAREWFDISLAWVQLGNCLRDWKASLDRERLTFVVDAWFLEDLIRVLTPNRDEEITYVTGVSFGGVKVLSRMCGVTLEQQSVVYARATAKSCANALATILEKGIVLHAMAHSHPGSGASATQESSIDQKYLGRIQRAGADVIGIIVTRDGFVRFFTVAKPFQVWVQGNGVIQIEENVYQITLFQTDRD